MKNKQDTKIKPIPAEELVGENIVKMYTEGKTIKNVKSGIAVKDKYTASKN